MGLKKKCVDLSLVLVCFGCQSVLLLAQPAPVQQFEENQRNRDQQESLLNNFTTTNAPELYSGENEDVGPQRILKIKPTPTYFEGLADTQYAYTDNNRLTDVNKTSTAYTINTVQLAFAPLPYELGEGKFAPRIGLRSQWYNYGLDGSGGGENRLDFEAQTFFASGQYLWHTHWEFDGEVDYTRLVTQRDYEEFYSETMPELTVQRLFQLKDNLIVSLSLQEAYHFSKVPDSSGTFRDVNDRLDSIAGLTASFQAFGRLVLQPYYRFDHTYYPRDFADAKRNDFLHTVGLSATYYFTRQISTRIYASGSFRTSDDPNTSSYEKFDTGIGASLLLRF